MNQANSTTGGRQSSETFLLFLIEQKTPPEIVCSYQKKTGGMHAPIKNKESSAINRQRRSFPSNPSKYLILVYPQTD
ncbi:hypothetical protein JTE90_002071 [Oedothorax gibbosus]|uniref:Uncharacterized protein n=1 Tax=Oedothorax gibbosus TaxID=931172 RepID=A0AAV6UE83_9ARAC|nr:hypothetical protein JTE90_002071 [Oedothorax gibbosus]